MQQTHTPAPPLSIVGVAPLDPHAAPDQERLLIGLYINADEVTRGAFLRNADELKPADFRARHHQAIWRAVKNLEERGEDVNPPAVENELERAGLYIPNALQRGDVYQLLIDCQQEPAFLPHHAAGYVRAIQTASDARRGEQALGNALAVVSDTTVTDLGERRALVDDALREWRSATDKAAPSRFKPLSLSELRAIPAAPDLVKGLIPTDANVGLIAPYASFKSFLLLDLGLSVAAGMTWAGKATYSGPVVYICGEGRSKIARRMEAWGIARRVDVDALPFTVIPNMPRLMDAREVDELITAIQGVGVPVLIIFDTLARAMMGGDENSARDTSMFVAAMDRIRAAFDGPTVMYAHHEGWTGGRGRGSSNLPAALDTELRIERQGDLATLTSSKQKDGDDSIPVVFKSHKVELGVDEDGELITSLVLDLVSGPVERRPTPDDVQEQAVLSFIKAKPGVSENAIRKAIPPPCFTENDVRKAVRRLLLSGKVRSEDGPRNSMALYAV